MEFEVSNVTGNATKIKQNKNKNKNKKKKANNKKKKQEQQDVNETTSNAKELSAFLFLLGMAGDEDCKHDKVTAPWTSDEEHESCMSTAYISALTTQDQSILEAEFLRQFRTHLAWKKYLSGPEMRRLKDRVFLLLAKEKEAGEGAGAEGWELEQALYGHFLYEELRLQHQYLTTPQVGCGSRLS